MEEPRRLGGRYELGAVLGRGGMAEVYLAHDTRLGRTVAVKTLRADLARDPSFQARFRREAQSAASLNHPAIVAVYDTGEDYVDGVSIPYIVMEYVDGSTLRELLHSGRKLLPERALEMTVGILQALEYSHRAGIVHRDIKPANVMLTRTGQVKVMDFGIARAMGDSGMTMTQTAAVIGTAQYLSPEQAKGEQVDARSDLYSTGCLLYELLTVRPPFIGDSPVAVAYQHVREEPQPPSVFDPEVTPAYDSIVLKALAKSPDDRYQSADEMRADIERALDGLPVNAPAAMGAAAYGDYGQGGYGDGAATTAMHAHDGGPRTSMLPPIDGGDGGDDEYGGRASRRQPPKKSRSSVILLVLAAILVLAGAFFVGKAIFDAPPKNGTQVPVLTGLTASKAKTQLANAGLVYKEGAPKNCDQPKRTVCSTDPAAGEPINKNETVTVFLSKGPKAIEVPDETGKTFAEAAQDLRDKGFKVARDNKTSDQAEPGTVIDQDPTAGETASPNATITLTVARKPEVQLTEVPDVVGKSFDDAVAALKERGLNATKAEEDAPDKPADTVFKQSPSAGSKVNPGETITLTVPKAAEQKVPVPNLAGKTVQQARQDLQRVGLNLAVGQGSDDPNALVVSQDPANGTEVDPNSTVTVTTVGPSNDGGNGNGGNGNGGGFIGGNVGTG
ncbi:Stk1 family PASTA domain-containing Ser/Thr kinase [Wenjunlia tyrosinilytica]|uniref:non-specific serine/threonine protein kinase n=1 Tax=Wenjunlia tyrosinilytica TaxID=1544741 RepID=A0A917ZN75_9ACTN|nr:Stk1 family PASTA domain-containing Ser/Thr kinase [Wenjunlia tyrosinilytica]GGO86126.1 putative serine/threonine-protein kinase [Wenjunlia tyrosinilytica]